MKEFILYFLGALLLYSAIVYFWHKISNEEINFKNYKLYLALFLASTLGALIKLYIPDIFRIALIVVMLCFVNYIFFYKDLAKSVAAVFTVEFLAMVCETLLVTILTIVLGENNNVWDNNMLMFLLINSGVFGLLLLSFKLPFVYKIYNNLESIFRKMGALILIIFIITIIFVASIFMIASWKEIPRNIIVIINTLFIIIYGCALLKIFHSEMRRKIIQNKYKTSLTALKHFEDLMDDYRIAHHEDKNQLQIIKQMIISNDKNVVNYIENLIGIKEEEHERNFYNEDKIPDGGLKALIQCKIFKMRKLNIPYTLNISNDVKTSHLIGIDDMIISHICHIIGVFLDNAIEEVQKLDDKKIIIELFMMDNYLCIDISNKFKGTLDVKKMDIKKYTTKGENRGYGLALVKKLVNRNKYLENERIIYKNRFTQRLKVLMNAKSM